MPRERERKSTRERERESEKEHERERERECVDCGDVKHITVHAAFEIRSITRNYIRDKDILSSAQRGEAEGAGWILSAV